MPYVNPHLRVGLEVAPAQFSTDHMKNAKAGTLNYVLTMFILAFIGRTPDYERYALVEGVLGHITKEIYRRKVEAFEEEAIVRNGDIPGFQ